MDYERSLKHENVLNPIFRILLKNGVQSEEIALKQAEINIGLNVLQICRNSWKNPQHSHAWSKSMMICDPTPVNDADVSGEQIWDNQLITIYTN